VTGVKYVWMNYEFINFIYRVAQKMAQLMLNALTLSNINRFSNFFHCQKQEKICNNIITKDPTTPQVCRYTALWNVYDQWREQWNAAAVCPTQWRLPAIAGWLSWIVDFDRPSAEGHPNSVIDWIQVRAVWGPHVRLDERNVLMPQVRQCVLRRAGSQE